MARFELLRQITHLKLSLMTIKSDLILCIFESPDGKTISELAELYPDISRRMLQRHLKDLVDRHEIVAVGNGRARKYYGPKVSGGEVTETVSSIPVSVDSLVYKFSLNAHISLHKRVRQMPIVLGR